MNWFSLAIIAPFLYALTNHIDKILIAKFFKEGGVGTLLIFSSLLSAFALPFLYWADPGAFSVSLEHILVLAVVGVMNVLVLWCYLLAIQDEEASVAVVFYQLVPVFGYVLGYFVLGETLSNTQLVAMATVILGTTIISFELGSGNTVRLRRDTVVYMVLASLFWALGSVIFKAVALEENAWRSMFWEHFMLMIVGILLFVFVRSYRAHFLEAFRENRGSVLAWCGVNELLYISGNVIFAYAYLLAPVSLVLLLNSFQPIFVLAIGIVFTVFFPHLSVERIEARHLSQKILAICISGTGTYFLLGAKG